jgi:phosphate transport system permease protein
MIFPTITVISHAAIEAVPRSYLYASAALGVCRSSTIRHVVFHQARPGIFSAATLGAARAIGETIVVLMVCGNVVQVPRSLMEPVRTLTANIALEMPYAGGMHQSALYATGLVVLCVVTALVVLSEINAHQARSRQS